MRQINSILIFPFLKISGFRFSKDYRLGKTKYHQIIYLLVDTINANCLAENRWKY